MLVKYVEGNGKIKDLDGALQTTKKLSLATLGARWPRSTESLGFYTVKKYQIFVMWCLPHVLDHLDLGLDSILGGIGAMFIEVGRLFYTHSRSYGWTSQSRQNAQELLVAWHVCLEESVGPNLSPLEPVAGIHSRAFFFGLSSVKVTTFILKMMANKCFAGFLVAKSHISLFERLQKFCTKFQLVENNQKKNFKKKKKLFFSLVAARLDLVVLWLIDSLATLQS